ncbi:caspase family protein [Chitinophaga sp. GCM10012297]|uniref:Caspase family protein n=1 Tax=Chitinophaga chungangae TaxID=2821488 RepID=A0ABS3YGF4_9BACT|nr:caspase family protein [Chitinophaga chungangae]MBO9153535.1 caspase family protein [Chitinophaga chungangae]
MQKRKFYAAFVGINAYPQGALSGCIHDVLRMDLLFRQQTAQQPDMQYLPVYYLAPNAADERQITAYRQEQEAELAYDAPTFANITGKLFGHFEKAGEGDVCVLFYSGHGSQTEAPEEFYQDNPGRKMETLVCVDSRTAARDLIDKELAYLLWKTFSATQAHCVVIMDCCHSGNNTRALVNEDDVQFRFQPASRNRVAFKDFIGYGDSGFYTFENGRPKIGIPRYVHLAACRNDEKAQESMRGGLFTGKLTEVLRAGATAASYRDLVQRLEITVSSRADRQHPVAFSFNDADLDQQFLSSSMQPYKPSFEVRFNDKEQVWKLYGGELHGIAAGDIVQVKDGERTAEVPVTAVFPMYAIISPEGFDTESLNVRATVVKANRAFMIVESEPDKDLEEAYRKGKFPFLQLSFTPNTPGAQYKVRRLEDGQYVLTGYNGELPLFRREPNAKSFAGKMNTVANWRSAKELKHLDEALTKDHFIFEWEAVEGQTANDAAEGKPVTGDDIRLHYKDGKFPAFRLRITLKEYAPVERCFIKALYLGSKYGIFTDLIRNDQPALLPGESVSLEFAQNNKLSKTIPVSIDPAYKNYQVTEVTDYLKIIVSTAEFDADRYKQDSLQLDLSPQTAKTRDLGGGEEVNDQPYWSVFTFSVTCVAESSEQQLPAGGTADFGAFTITAPQGFSAKATAITETNTRSMNDAPSPDIWGEEKTDNGLNGSIAAIELQTEGTLKPGEPLVIRQSPPAAAVRSIDGAQGEEVIVPFGFDHALQMYVPLGYADDEGNIFVEELPSSPVNTRSLMSAVKLYFKKVFRSKNTNTLAIYRFKDGKWETVDKLEPAAKATLLVHGIIGDTQYMKEVFMAQDSPPDYIMTYDYENLSTPVSETATRLDEALKAAGMGQAGMPDLTIVAHSMGGLVSRWLTEKVKDTGYIKKLILVGSPCSGSEMAGLSSSARDLLTQALNVTGPVKFVITGLAYLVRQLKINPATTLKELTPGSQLLQDLALSPMKTGVEYHIIAGNTALLENYSGDDFFLRKVATIVKEKIVYPGLSYALYDKEANDMAVTLKSMFAIPALNKEKQVREVASNHLSYFREPASMNELMNLIHHT